MICSSLFFQLEYGLVTILFFLFLLFPVLLLAPAAPAAAGRSLRGRCRLGSFQRPPTERPAEAAEAEEGAHPHEEHVPEVNGN